MSTDYPHEEHPSSTAPPAQRDELMARLPALVHEIRVGAEQRDLERQLPFEALARYKASGLSQLRVPVSLGGPGGSIADYMESIAALAQADSNVGHILRLHFNYVEQQILAPQEQREPHAIERILAGNIFGGAHTEQGTQRPGEITVRLSREGDHFRLNGRKWYATGTAFSDYAGFSALDDDDNPVTALIPVTREGISILDDWDGMGQRLTASGGVLLENVKVLAEEVSQRAPSSLIGRHTATLRQLHLAACATGIVRNILADAIDYARHHGRTTAHSPATTSREDHFVQQVVGDIAARSAALDASLAQAAKALDGSAELFFQNASEEAIDASLIAGSLATAQTQLTIANLGLPAAEKIFEIGGGSATSRKYDFDRHWRNLRTVLNHNPLLHKARVLGDYYLNGTTDHLREGRVF